MSESTDFYMSWLGCGAFGAQNSRITALEPIVFLPTDLSNCAIWFDANNSDSIAVDPLDNSSLLSWNNLGDLSGSMTPATGTGNYNVDTINALNVVQFPVGNTMSWYNAIPDQEKTSFIVAKGLTDLTTILNPYMDLWSGAASQGYQLGYSYVRDLDTFVYAQCRSGDWCVYSTTGTNPYNTPQLVSYRITTDLSSNFIRINSVNQTLLENHTADLFNTFPIPYVVNRDDGSSQDIAEIIIYNRALTDVEVAQVEAYLTAKWAIT